MYEDLPKRKVWEILYEAFYGEDVSAGFTVLGPKKNIKKMQRDDFVDFYKKHYSAERTKVVISGNFDLKKILKESEVAFGDIASSRKVPLKKISTVQKNPIIKIQKKNSDQTALLVAFRSFPRGHKDRAVLAVLATILGQGFSSRLHKKLREEQGLCYYVYAHPDRYTNRGQLVIGAGVGHKNLNLAVELILEECQNLTQDLVDKKELKKTKDYILGTSALGLETSGDWADYYGFQAVHNQTLRTPHQKSQEIQKVTAQDVRRVAKKIFKNEGLAVVVVGPKVDEESFKKTAHLKKK
jgi:predicted Zn-dependent peptidase